jgi:hypothetical protein
VIDAANNSTGKAEVCVWSGSATGTTATTDYAIGVVSTGERDSVDQGTTAAKFYFVKLDGVSPNYTAAGAYDTLHRANLVNNSYKFATEMGAYVKSTTNLTTGNGKISAAVANAIAQANNSNLAGIAYLTGGSFGDGKTSRFSKGGNNCAAWQ